MHDAKNPIEELSELFVVPPTDVDDGSNDKLYCQLRFGEAELALDDGTVFKVAVIRAFLALDLAGLIILPGSEYGATIKENLIDVKCESKESNELKKGGAIGGQLGSSSSLGISGSAEQVTTLRTSKASETHVAKTRVTPRGGQKWEILAIDEEKLDGDYLSPQVALCHFKSKKGANQQAATTRVYVKQRDMKFSCDNPGLLAGLKLSRNKEKLLNILIAKALNSCTATGKHVYTGALILSEAHSEHEA